MITGSVVIVKFFINSNQKSDYNPLITRTLKKIGVINRNYKAEIEPNDGELWKVKIDGEVCENQTKGCFILSPIECVDPKNICKLLPGIYIEEVYKNILLIYPKIVGNWILPLGIKRNLNKYRAIIVKLNNEDINKEGIK